jgi:hypothetical protein
MFHEIVVDLVLNEIINLQEESWKTVPKSSGGKVHMELTRSLITKSSEIYNNVTVIVKFAEDQKHVQIEIEEEWYVCPNYIKHGHDVMGRFIVEDDSCHMIVKPKPNAKEKRQCLRLEILNRPQDDGQAVKETKSAVQKRSDQQQNAKKTTDKTQAKPVIDANRRTRKQAQFIIISSHDDL